jgi:phenylacetate-CoA ligase
LIRKYLNSILKKRKLNQHLKEVEYIRKGLPKFFVNEEYDSNVSSYTKSKTKDILYIAIKNTKYYSDTFKKHNIDINSPDDFKRIPFLTKEIIRNNYSDLINSNDLNLNFYKMNTGGSTGQPLEFEVSGHASVIDGVHQRFQYNFLGYKEGDIIAAFTGGVIPQDLRDQNIYFLKRDKNFPYGMYKFSSVYLTNENIKFYVKGVLDIKPNILRGYPSFLNDLAAYIVNNDIDLGYKVKAIEITSELAHDWQIENMKKAFKCPVFGQYGNSEVTVFAITKDDSMEYICSPFYGITEIVDHEGNHVKPGEEGEVITTSFHNERMPFIRYRTGDRAIFKGYENQSLVMSKLLGRSQDYVYKKDMQKIALTAIIFGLHFKAFKVIKKWQIVQSKPGFIEIYIIKSDDYNKSSEDEIRKIFKEIGSIETDFKYVDEIPLTKSGKHLFLVQNIK